MCKVNISFPPKFPFLKEQVQEKSSRIFHLRCNSVKLTHKTSILYPPAKFPLMQQNKILKRQYVGYCIIHCLKIGKRNCKQIRSHDIVQSIESWIPREIKFAWPLDQCQESVSKLIRHLRSVCALCVLDTVLAPVLHLVPKKGYSEDRTSRKKTRNNKGYILPEDGF